MDVNKLYFTVFTPAPAQTTCTEHTNPLKKQKIKNLKRLIVDDGATDNTKENLESFIFE